MITKTEPRRPGRPKSQEKRDAIRQAGAQLFLAVGWAGTTMDAIAQGAGVSKQTVYSHFNCKEDLFRECVQSKISLYELDVEDGHGTLSDSLGRFATRLLELFQDEEVIRMFRLMVAHATEFPQLVQNFQEAGPDTTKRTVANLLRQALPEDSAVDPDAAAAEFIHWLTAPVLIKRLLNLPPDIPNNDYRAHVERSVHEFLLTHGISANG